MKKIKMPVYSALAIPFGLASFLLTAAAFSGSREIGTFFDAGGRYLLFYCGVVVPFLVCMAIVRENRRHWVMNGISILLWLPFPVVMLLVL